MNTITFDNADLLLFQPLFDRFKIKTTVVENDDFYYDLSAEDVENIEKSKEQKRLGLYKHTSEVHKLIQEKYGIVLDK
nr:hypothetical protein [uncultured Capnocytophaga sp.]